MSKYLSSFLDQAQNAVQSSPLANKLPLGQHRPASPGAQDSTSGSHTRKSQPFAALNHQFRVLKEQYGDSSHYQRMVTTSKGVIMDFESVAKDAKANSKVLYEWGHTEPNDLKDVTDRLAYFQFAQGSLAASLAEKLEAARLPLKNLRDKEGILADRMKARNNYIQFLDEAGESGKNTKKVVEIKELLRKAEIDDEPLEKEVLILERKAIKDSEHAKWEAIREYGEKLALLAQASSQVLQVLPSVPPTPTAKYEGAPQTAAIRATVQKALDNWKPGHVDFPLQHAAVDLNRSDTKSFGETHANELSKIGPSTSNHPSGTTLHDPPVHFPVPTTSPGLATSPPVSAPPIQPESLNLAPAPLPSPKIPPSDNMTTSHTSGSDPIDSPIRLPQVTPTIAETGVPKSGGPGPASGSLLEVKAEHDSQGGGGRVPEPGQSGPAGRFETAEEEKRRLERERQAGGSSNTNPGPGPENHGEDEDQLPPYKEF